jgi:hypothetical protein
MIKSSPYFNALQAFNVRNTSRPPLITSACVNVATVGFVFQQFLAQQTAVAVHKRTSFMYLQKIKSIGGRSGE